MFIPKLYSLIYFAKTPMMSSSRTLDIVLRLPPAGVLSNGSDHDFDVEGTHFAVSRILPLPPQRPRLIGFLPRGVGITIPLQIFSASRRFTTTRSCKVESWSSLMSPY